MIRYLLLTAAAMIAVSASAPVPAHAADSRLVTRLYSKEEVVRVEGRLGVQATIAFADDEHIENVAIGDSATWQVTPNQRANLLFVKPLAARARTNMTVVTDRHTYFFDLVAGGSPSPLYVLRFTYPEPPKPAPQPAAGDQAGGDRRARGFQVDDPLGELRGGHACAAARREKGHMLHSLGLFTRVGRAIRL